MSWSPLKCFLVCISSVFLLWKTSLYGWVQDSQEDRCKHEHSSAKVHHVECLLKYRWCLWTVLYTQDLLENKKKQKSFWWWLSLTCVVVWWWWWSTLSNFLLRLLHPFEKLLYLIVILGPFWNNPHRCT